jgi:hypothetical protein
MSRLLELIEKHRQATLTMRRATKTRDEAFDLYNAALSAVAATKREMESELYAAIHDDDEKDEIIL